MGPYHTSSLDAARHTPDQTIDRWLRTALHGRFDGVLTEPLPGDLLALLDDANPGRQPAHRLRD